MANLTDTDLLNQIIDDAGLKRRWLAEQLNLSPYGLTKKINNENEFKQSEIETLCRLLSIKTASQRMKIFFSNKVD